MTVGGREDHGQPCGFCKEGVMTRTKQGGSAKVITMCPYCKGSGYRLERA